MTWQLDYYVLAYPDVECKDKTYTVTWLWNFYFIIPTKNLAIIFTWINVMS